ncbi:glutaminase A [Flavobacterium sp. MC2016-06]|jgi:glutaminase|uniref:glutaminase A n=1 Tax=Flavobacterium sp. MC2016-06 TaxID=2676308 RepID=UPI0012BB091D|nr:glutaminase A [Flavobacterium sp. MC2016-06]MBU3857771.1 glutaminase A [Flavobacterium sp. MC2016-06]
MENIKTKNTSKITNSIKKENEVISNPISRIAETEKDYLFASILAEGKINIQLSELFRALEAVGIEASDSRLNFCETDVRDAAKISINQERFKEIVKNSRGDIIKDALQGNLIIPDFSGFCESINVIFRETKNNNKGNVATYIPQLSRVDPSLYGISVCSTDGQKHSIGDSKEKFSVQSICKPINYCIALEGMGVETVHKHVGREPSGIGFNGLVLNDSKLPHNPMINAGAIMTCSLIRPDLAMSDRFEYVLKIWERLSGEKQNISFNNAVYLSEKSTADRNFALGYFMKENGAFPKDTNLLDTLEFYFQCCSIQTDTDSLAVIAATLANGGVCPTTGERILSSESVKNCLSLMNSCGMYDFSGEFAFTIGLPAKSGVAGGLMLVIPNLMGIVIWSPKLDSMGNTVRGIEFCKSLVKHYNFHNYDNLTAAYTTKTDARLPKNHNKIEGVINLCWAASEGDLLELQHLFARGFDLNMADYDGRTALHLAASEGHKEVVEYLIKRGALADSTDRWGNTPFEDAQRNKHVEVMDYLSSINKNIVSVL